MEIKHEAIITEVERIGVSALRLSEAINHLGPVTVRIEVGPLPPIVVRIKNGEPHIERE